VATLRRELRRILGLTRPWHVAIMGMGRLGQALADYPNYDRQEFLLEAAFDLDPALVGRRFGDLTVDAVADVTAVVTERGIDLAFLTVPGHAAQAAADALVGAGVRGILSFAPTVVSVPEHVRLERVDLSAGLQRLTYYLHGAPGTPT
jgi:redox-sensing transcriptional repressor